MKKFFECLLPVTACNLECEYCYIIQRDGRKMKVPKPKYSVEHMVNALSRKRLGGICFFSICGGGETLLPEYLLEFVKGLLLEGHYVNITTNGTLTKRFLALEEFPKDLLEHLHISFSFHYLELKNRGLIDVFFDNVQRMKRAGCSILVQINLYDGYLPYIEEIKEICKEKVGAWPQVAATRKEEAEGIQYYTRLSSEEYFEIGKKFESPLFDFTHMNFNKKRREFCYAGVWSYTLDLYNGNLKSCYAEPVIQNIFEDISLPIKQKVVGHGCKSPFCMNSSHFMSMGIIPEIDTPSYAELRNREEAGWYTKTMKDFFAKRLYMDNPSIGKVEKVKKNVIVF